MAFTVPLHGLKVKISIHMTTGKSYSFNHFFFFSLKISHLLWGVEAALEEVSEYGITPVPYSSPLKTLEAQNLLVHEAVFLDRH